MTTIQFRSLLQGFLLENPEFQCLGFRLHLSSSTCFSFISWDSSNFYSIETFKITSFTHYHHRFVLEFTEIAASKSQGEDIKVLNMMELKRGISKQRCRTAHIVRNRSNMYAKRLKGLFMKAGELSEISGCEIAIIVLSEDGRPHSFAAGPGNPTVHQILEFYTSGSFCLAAQNKFCHSSKLCYCQIAILVPSPTLGRRPYRFSAGPHCPSFGDIVHAYLAAPTTSTPHSFSPPTAYPLTL